MDLSVAQASVERLLESFGVQLPNDVMEKTPGRVAKAWNLFTSGYGENPASLLTSGVLHQESDDLVLIRNIDYFSVCEHHLLPFFGKCHVCYRPRGKVVGFSKLVRVVDAFSRRLQVQERMTAQIADTIHTALNCQGVAVVVTGYHTCMAMRGVERENAEVTTSAMRGLFEQDEKSRAEFFKLLNP